MLGATCTLVVVLFAVSQDIVIGDRRWETDCWIERHSGGVVLHWRLFSLASPPSLLRTYMYTSGIQQQGRRQLRSALITNSRLPVCRCRGQGNRYLWTRYLTLPGAGTLPDCHKPQG